MADGAKCYRTLSSVHDMVIAHMNSQELQKNKLLSIPMSTEESLLRSHPPRKSYWHWIDAKRWKATVL